MIPFILIGAALVAGAVVYTFWDEIKSALKKAAEKVKTIVKATILGFKTYIQTKEVSSAVNTFYKFYHKKENGNFVETVLQKEITFDELPPEIKAKAGLMEGKEVDISDELQHELT